MNYFPTVRFHVCDPTGFTHLFQRRSTQNVATRFSMEQVAHPLTRGLLFFKLAYSLTRVITDSHDCQVLNMIFISLLKLLNQYRNE